VDCAVIVGEGSQTADLACVKVEHLPVNGPARAISRDCDYCLAVFVCSALDVPFCSQHERLTLTVKHVMTDQLRLELRADAVVDEEGAVRRNARDGDNWRRTVAQLEADLGKA